ncbi:ECF RNA polymerase sigma factor RpoE [compost metagenome]
MRQTHNWNRRLWRKWRLFERSKLLDMSDRAPDSEDLYLRTELYQDLLKQVHRLSYKFRSVIVLRYYQDCTFEEISKLLDIPEGTAKSRHRLALQKLRKLMGSTAEEILFPKETIAHVHSE